MLSSSAASSADFKLEQTVNGMAAGETSGGIFRVTDTGGQSAAGTSESGLWRIEHGFWSTFSSPPVPGAIARTVPSGQKLELPFETIASQVTDPDADPVRIHSIAPLSARGGTVVLGATSLTYTPHPAFVGVDRFTYLLVDAGGDVASGAVTVTVGAAAPRPSHVVYGPVVTNGVLLVRYEGVPGLTYTIETCERLEAGAWRKLLNVTAPADAGAFGPGIFEIQDAVNTASSRFFRVVWPAY